MSVDPFVYSGPYPTRMAVVDLGSNSVKMVCYAVDHTGVYRPYHRESSRIRLDEYGDGTIQEEQADRLMEILALFHNTVLYENVGRVLAVATSAVRGADNAGTLLERIRNEVGFEFFILSGDAEGLYSYAGAATHLSIPSCVFFDIGGGSLEIVSTRNHTIMRTRSLPLGALVTTRRFANGDEFDEESAKRLRRYIRSMLPDDERVGRRSDTTVLVGVGGTLRAIAKYVQHKTEYPLRKLHNYTMDVALVRDVAAEILESDTETLANMYEIGQSRADIVKAGVVTVLEIIEWFGFERIIVSAAGLREGVLEMSLRHPGFRLGDISEYHVRELIRAPPGTPTMPDGVVGVLEPLKRSKLLHREEKTVLQAAAANLHRLKLFRDADYFLYHMMDHGSPLSHRIQLLAALCLAYSKKPKRTKMLMNRYNSMLYEHDEVTIRRLSAIIKLCDLVTTAEATAHMTILESSIDLQIRYQSCTIPKTVLDSMCQRIGGMMDRTINVTNQYGIHQ